MNKCGLVIALLIMSSAAFSATAVDFQFLPPVVAMVVVVFIALAIMLSHSINLPAFDVWVKNELREFIVGVILIVVVTGAVIGSNSVAQILSGSSTPALAATQVMDHWLSQYYSSSMDAIRAINRLRIAVSYSPSMSSPSYYVGVSYSSAPLSGAAGLLQPLSAGIQALTNAAFVIEGLRLIVLFMSNIAVPVLFPIAFALRLVPFTRKAGNTLIALVLAGVVILPFSILITSSLNSLIPPAQWPDPHLVMNREVDFKSWTGIGKTSETPLNILDANPWAMTVAEPFCSSVIIRILLAMTDLLFGYVTCLPLLFIPYANAFYMLCVEINQNVVYQLIVMTFQSIYASAMMPWLAVFDAAGASRVYAENGFEAIFMFLKDVNNLVLIGYLDMLMIATLTVGGARSLSAALGGEWYMAGIQRLI